MTESIRRTATAALLIVLLGSGCGDDSADPTTTSGSSTTAPGTSTTTTGDSATSAETVLADAIAAVGDSYAFESTVTVGEVEITRVDGEIDGDIGSYVVESGGATLEYIVSPTRRWVREPGGDWVALDQPAPVRPPLVVLATPRSVVFDSESGGTVVLTATYDGALLGFAAGDLRVDLTIVDGVLHQITYTVSIGEGTAAVVTTIDADAQVGPIVLPGS